MRRFFFSEIRRNDLLSIALITFFLTFFMGIAFVFGYFMGFWLTGVVFIVMLLVIAYEYYYSDRIVLRHFKARPANMRDLDEAEFQHAVEEMAIAAGLPTPKAYVIDDPAPNAFATGRNPEHAVICATTGLLKMMDKDEVLGVVGHEMGHVKNKDTKIMTLAAVMAGTIVALAFLFRNAAFYGGLGRNRDSGQAVLIVLLAALIASIVAPIFAAMIKAVISRKREFMADATSAMLTRYPEGLARALEKIAGYKKPMKNANTGNAHLFIANPLGSVNLKGVFSTHPPIEERIKRLREM